MDRSFFHRSSNDHSPLLPMHSSSNTYSLDDLPPQPYQDSSPPSRRSLSSGSPSRRLRRSSNHHSTIPPPIVASVLLAPQRPSRSRSPAVSRHRTTTILQGATNPTISLTRQEKAIHGELQQLLDAQSAGLASGRVGDDYTDGTSDAGSTTPTTRSMAASRVSGTASQNGEPRGVIPVRQPRKKKITLHGARRGILHAMSSLSTLKTHELSILDVELANVQHLSQQVESWEKKLLRFRKHIEKLSQGNEGREIADLKSEKSAVATEIRDLEERLMQLRARDAHLSRRIQELGNRSEAALSSYEAGTREVEREVANFLSRPPVLDVAAVVLRERGEVGGDAVENFLALPPGRRTLEMAKDYFSSSRVYLEKHRGELLKERDALDQGTQLWSDVVGMVTGLERELRAQMAGGQAPSIQELQDQLLKMGVIVDEVENIAAEVEAKGWNLLICAVGAELEAFREGREVLRGVMETLDPTHKVRTSAPPHTPQHHLHAEETFTSARSHQSIPSSFHNGINKGKAKAAHEDLFQDDGGVDGTFSPDARNDDVDPLSLQRTETQETKNEDPDPGRMFLDKQDSQDSERHAFLAGSSFGLSGLMGSGTRGDGNDVEDGEKVAGKRPGMRRAPSSFAESEDDGPPGELLVGLEDGEV